MSRLIKRAPVFHQIGSIFHMSRLKMQLPQQAELTEQSDFPWNVTHTLKFVNKL